MNKLHRLDPLLVLTLIGFAMTSLLFDRTAALDIVSPDSADPFARALHWYASRWDPLVAANPFWLQVMSGISAFVFGPFDLYLAYALWRRIPSVRVPALVYGGVMLYSVVVHVIVELAGDLRPPSLAVFTGVYASYAVVPALLVARLWHPDPFKPTASAPSGR